MSSIDHPSNTINSIMLTEQTSAPATPPSGKEQLYISSSGLYLINSGGSIIGPMSSAKPNRKNVSISDSPYTVVSSFFTFRCNANSASIVINLPPAVGSGQIYTIKNLYTSTCIVQVVADTSGTPDLIDGQATQTLSVKSSMQIQDGATNFWDIL